MNSNNNINIEMFYFDLHERQTATAATVIATDTLATATACTVTATDTAATATAATTTATDTAAHATAVTTTTAATATKCNNPGANVF
jgi:hypothetical protein